MNLLFCEDNLNINLVNFFVYEKIREIVLLFFLKYKKERPRQLMTKDFNYCRK